MGATLVAPISWSVTISVIACLTVGGIGDEISPVARRLERLRRQRLQFACFPAELFEFFRGQPAGAADAVIDRGAAEFGELFFR
jgi:hypothetical protein